MDLRGAVLEYCGSEHFRFLDDALKPYAEDLLSFWSEQIDMSVTEEMSSSQPETTTSCGHESDCGRDDRCQ